PDASRSRASPVRPTSTRSGRQSSRTYRAAEKPWSAAAPRASAGSADCDRLVDLPLARDQFAVLLFDPLGLVLVVLHQLRQVDAGHVQHAHVEICSLHLLAPQPDVL